MGKTIRFIGIILVAAGLAACGNPELDEARAKVNSLQGEVGRLRVDLDTEIAAKKRHAVLEEKYKNLHKQAERDHRAALDKLKACQGNLPPRPKKK